MAKKYIFANSAAYNGSLYNLPKGVTVLEFDTETNSLGIYNNKKAVAAIPVQPEKDNDNNFEIPKIPEKLSELQNDKAFITLKDVQGKLNNIVIPTKLSAFENDKKFISTSEAEAKFALKTDSTSFLQEITYNEINKVLSFIFKLSDGTLTTQDISISDLVDVYTAGDNIKIEGNKISFTGVIPSVSDFITINDVNNALINYAKKQDIPTVDSFITIEDVMQVLNDYVLKTNIPTKLSDFQNDTKFITIDSVKNELSDYALKTDIPEIPDVSNFATKQELPKVDKFITSDDITSTLSDYALKTDIPTVPEIPSKLSELQNDTKFITLNDVPSSITEDFVNNAIKAFAKDYTAFEVMPNKVIISAGTIDNITGLEYKQEIPVCTEHKFTLRSANSINNNDVIIDWGDGTVEAIKDGKYEWKSNKQYDLSHDYSTSMTSDIQRFIIKIYGRDYYTFRHNSSKDNNLISRIFAEDLPIASHVGNLASAAIYANRLLKVHFPHSTSPYSNVWNWSYTFSNCKNLQSVTGFEDLILRGDAWYDGFMTECINLKNTDFVIPATVTSLKGVFDGDINLECDIAKLLPKNGFSSSNILIKNVFNKTKIYGSIPADKLWNDKNINWVFEGTTNMPFKDCSNEILSQVPVSWGGIKAEEIFIPEQLKIDYTAFEVMPNKVDIDDYAVKVSACTIHKFTLRSAKDFADNDVVIDWGDGTIEAIKDGKYEWKSGKQYDLSHDYSSTMTKDVQTFIVKIYGKDYYTFRNNSFPDNNLISRIFDVDLPVASHIGNFASMCLGATRLINVTIPHSTKYVTTAFNFSSTFESAVNLVSVIGFEDSPLRCDCLISNIFNKCKSLTTTDFAIPSCALSIAGIFAGCTSLVTAKRLIPLCGVLGAGKININSAWLNVPEAITATIPQSLGGTLAE